MADVGAANIDRLPAGNPDLDVGGMRVFIATQDEDVALVKNRRGFMLRRPPRKWVDVLSPRLSVILRTENRPLRSRPCPHSVNGSSATERNCPEIREISR